MQYERGINQVKQDTERVKAQLGNNIIGHIAQLGNNISQYFKKN